MSARELIKHLEGCDLDKDVCVVVSLIGETDSGYNVLLREIKDVVEQKDVIGIT